jgi:hypothetical protein
MQFHTMFQDMSEVCQCLKFHQIHGSHWSADLTRRSRLFICVETNKSWRLELSSAFAVSRVNSGQFLSGLCISVQEHYWHLRWKCLLSSPSSCTKDFGGCCVLKTLARYMLWKVISAISLALAHLSWKFSRSFNLIDSWIIWASNLVNITTKGTVISTSAHWYL